MTLPARYRLAAVWLILVLVTVLSWRVAAGDSSFQVDRAVTATVLGLAFVKAGLIMWEFMEVRSAPLWLRLTCAAWLAVVLTVLATLSLA